MEDSSAKFTL